MLLLLRWLLFRVEFGAGLIKMRGDDCWRKLTCLDYHHETQPMPGPLSWFFHHLPAPLHRVEVAANHVAQLVVPWLLFAPSRSPARPPVIIVVTQLWLVLSGNFSWLNWLTMTLAVIGPRQRLAARPPRVDPPVQHGAPVWYEAVVIAVAVVLVALSYWPARNLLSRRQVMNASFNPLHLVNTYGAFGSITRVRHEIVVEGTDDPTPGRHGLAGVRVQGQARRLRRRPAPVRAVPPAARLADVVRGAVPGLRPAVVRPFVGRLLENDPATLRLLRTNPFPDGPPALVRARLYRYRYTTHKERRTSGDWWVREWVGEYLRPVRTPSAPEPASR